MKLVDFAAAEGRTYITPEDVQDAIDAGADRLALYTELLQWIERRGAEDASLCAFVALQFQRST
jgi:hypothetical protein